MMSIDFISNFKHCINHSKLDQWLAFFRCPIHTIYHKNFFKTYNLSVILRSAFGQPAPVRALLAVSRAVIETWRVDKLTVIDNLEINDLMLLLSWTDGSLLIDTCIYDHAECSGKVCKWNILCAYAYAFKTTFAKILLPFMSWAH